MTDVIAFTPQEVGIRTGQTAGQRIWLTVAYFDGVSLSNHPDTLARLAAVVEDRPLAEIHRFTNCATSRRWAWALSGCQHPWCHLPDEVLRPKAPAGPVYWDMQIAREMGALVEGLSQQKFLEMLDVGWTVFYGHPGANDDHVETIGSKPDLVTGMASHGGGGRGGNAITCGHGDVRTSLSRPIRAIADPSKLIPELRKFDEQVRDASGPEIAIA